MHTRRTGCVGHLLRLGEVASERPLAIDVLAGLQRGQHQCPMVRHLDGDGDEIDRRIGDQRQPVAMAGCRAERPGRLVGTPL